MLLLALQWTQLLYWVFILVTWTLLGLLYRRLSHYLILLCRKLYRVKLGWMIAGAAHFILVTIVLFLNRIGVSWWFRRVLTILNWNVVFLLSFALRISFFILMLTLILSHLEFVAILKLFIITWSIFLVFIIHLFTTFFSHSMHLFEGFGNLAPDIINKVSSINYNVFQCIFSLH